MNIIGTPQLDAKPYSDYALDWNKSGMTMGTTDSSTSSTVSAQPVTELTPFTTYIFQIK